MNTVINTGSPHQYKITNFSDQILDEEKAREELGKMKALMDPSQSLETLREYAPKISRLQDLIDKLTSTNGWDAHLIQKDDEKGEYRIFHQYINYKKENDVEYRVGIFVTNKVDGNNN